MSATVSIHMQATPPYFSDRCYYAPANQAFTIKFSNPVLQLKDNSPTSATLGGLCKTLLLLASGSLPGMFRKLVTRRIR